MIGTRFWSTPAHRAAAVIDKYLSENFTGGDVGRDLMSCSMAAFVPQSRREKEEVDSRSSSEQAVLVVQTGSSGVG